LEIYNNILCVRGGWLVNEGIITESNYDKLRREGKIKAERRANKGNPALIAYDSIPQRFKQVIVERYGDPYQTTKDGFFKQHIVSDLQALDFFNNYQLEDGRHLPEDTNQEYYHNAILLNAVHSVINTRIAKRKGLGGSIGNIWENMTNTVAKLEGYKHSLPNNVRRFREKYNAYLKEGYSCLIHKGFQNDNRRKVNELIELVLLSISAMPNRHFNTTVAKYYNDFIHGRLELYNQETGEMFNPSDFVNKNGAPLELSEGTVWNVLNALKNKPVMDKMRKSGIDFKTKTMPYNHRHRPQFSLSKVSMDDRALPRKGTDGWVSAYYAYDVASECFIGYSHSKDKDMNLVWECFRNMYSTLRNNNLPWPAEVEVENHLMKGISDQLYSMFSYVRFCNPQNSREKRAEHAIRSKKYGDEKKHQDNIGRWTAHHDAYGVNTDYEQKVSTKQLIADDIESIDRHNNAPHSIYKDRSRWQVLCESLNPELVPAQERILFKYMGNKTATSIRNNDFVQVQYAHYALNSGMDILSLMKPNNYSVEAYWLPNAEGTIGKVYLYQGDEYLGEATKYETYNEAQAERTTRDEEIRVEQAKRQATARKTVKDDVARKVVKIGLMPKTKQEFTEEEVYVPELVMVAQYKEPEFDTESDDYYTQLALNNL